MAVASASQIPQESLSYRLLMQKACQEAPRADSSADDQSTAEPASSSESISGAWTGAPNRDQVRLLRNVTVHDAHADEKMAALLRQTRSLSELVFGEDCLQEVTKKSGWKLSLLVSDDLQVLCGYIVSKVTKGALSISKIAVPAEFRGQGFGKLIMEELMKSAKKQGDVYEVCLSSLSTAVTFYQRLGFKAFKGLQLKADDLVEGQVYMEKKLRARRR